jgi:hypothetical protein
MNHGRRSCDRVTRRAIQGDAEMKRISLMGLALIAIFALGGFASASALAENPEILPVPTEAVPLTFTSTGGEAILQSTKEANKTTCAKEKAKGSFTTQDKGSILIDFEGCVAKGASCTSPGEAKGIILALGFTTLVDVLPTATLDLGVLIEPKEEGSTTADLKYECAGVFTVELLGAVISVIDNAKGELFTANTKTKELKVLTKASSLGEQEIKTCDLLKATCEGKTFGLTATFGKGEELAAKIADLTLTFEKEAEVHF